jgi:hypothetical protein
MLVAGLVAEYFLYEYDVVGQRQKWEEESGES